MRRCFLGSLIVVVATGSVLVLYLSWLGDSKMTLVPWIPGWLSGWADGNGTVRTGVPFVAIGAAMVPWLPWQRGKAWWWTIAWLALVALVGLAEFGQLRIPHRTASWLDVAWGAAGAAAGLAIGGMIRGGWKHLRASRG